MKSRKLTKRERQTAGLIGRGLSNPEIARELAIRPRTVKTYIGNIYRKLGMKKPGGHGRNDWQRIHLGLWWNCELFHLGLIALDLV